MLHRGDIVDDEALMRCIRIEEKFIAAGLDVYKNEPNLNPGYLKSQKCIFVLPHLGVQQKIQVLLWEI